MHLTRQDLADACAALGCDEAALKAVIEVEAAGKGFDAQGRPKILFEPHIFERELNKLGYPDDGEHVQWARSAGVASPKWNKALYPRDADGRWRQLETACQLSREAALKATSFGMPQICGFNHLASGFHDVEGFVAAMSQSEGQQVLAMARFILKARLDDELRAHDWAGFARGYNGPAYAQNHYDDKLAKAHRKHMADPEAFWREKPGGGWGPAAGQEVLASDGVDV